MTKEEFLQAVQQLRPRLTEQARHYLMDGVEAEDAVQEVLLRLWQMHERLHSPIDGLATVLTRNICIDLLRRRQRPVSSHPMTATNASESEAEAETDDHEHIERLMEVIDTLPDVQQTLLRLHHMQGMGTKEVAKLMQMNEAAVRKALSRARIAVRKQYFRRFLMVGSVALLIGAGAFFLFRHSQPQDEADECVVYVYGKQVTDPAVVMDELEQTLADMAATSTNDNIERQLNEMFNIE